MAFIKQLNINGTSYDFKDEGARQMIEDLGNALYWMGVTTTELIDGVTTSDTILVNGESKTAEVGGMAQYNGEEFVYDGTVWQSIGKNNFGDLAFEDTATGTFTPVGTVSQPTATVTPTTESVEGIDSVGTLPSMTVDNEVLTFNSGTLPTKAQAVTVMTGATVTVSQPTFSGTAGTVTVAKPTP